MTRGLAPDFSHILRFPATSSDMSCFPMLRQPKAKDHFRVVLRLDELQSHGLRTAYSAEVDGVAISGFSPNPDTAIAEWNRAKPASCRVMVGQAVLEVNGCQNSLDIMEES